MQLCQKYTFIQMQLPKGIFKIVYSLFILLWYFVFLNYSFLFIQFCMLTLLKINILLGRVGKPDGVVFIIQGNSLNCHQLKLCKKPAVLSLEFYKVESQEVYISCAHTVKTVPERKMERGWGQSEGPRSEA